MIFNELLDRPLAQKLWDYNQLKKPLRRADFIFVMCSYNLDVADYASILFSQKMGKFILVSGGIGHQNDLLKTGWDDPEAHVFKERLIERGVPARSIKVEDKATNCGENVLFTKELLKDHDPEIKTGLIVQKSYMERRAVATAEKQWPEIEWQATSPNILYTDYIQGRDEETTIHIMVGDTWRIKKYAELGYQTKQEMPEEVEEALNALIKKGYTQHIPKD